MSSRRLALVVILVVAALAWLPLNHPVEGAVLLVLTPDHGVTVADLLSVALVVAAVVVAVTGYRVQGAPSR